MFSLKGKVCIVTSGVGILGRHFCSGLAEMGAHVVVVDIDHDSCADFATHLTEQFHTECIGVGCDITNKSEIEKLLATVLKKFGQVDFLHNNAASKGKNVRDFFEPTETFSMDVWRDIMDVNVDALFMVAQVIGGYMAKSGRGGSIVQTGSIYGIVAPDQRIYEGSDYLGGAINTPAVYSTSKSGVVGLTKYLSTLWASQKVRVNCLVPGGVQSGQNQTFLEKYSNRVLMKCMA
jgi:NAD(P)-dependent dehydrogenase (short-subunit alcohol dehydrogenase family)